MVNYLLKGRNMQTANTNWMSANVATDVVMFRVHNNTLEVLLVKRAENPFEGYWALPGRFLEGDVTADQNAYRTLEIETNTPNMEETVFLEQLATYSGAARDQRGRVISVAYWGLVLDGSLDAVSIGPEQREVSWVKLQDALKTEMAFDHKEILQDGYERLAARMEYAPLVLSLAEAPFTLREIHSLYETIWNEKVDYSNFRRKLRRTPNLLVEHQEEKDETKKQRGRPADKYTLASAKLLYPPILRGEDKRSKS